MWPFRRHRRRDTSEADAAIRRAREEIARLEDQAPEVERISRVLRERRQSNHFGQGILRILRESEKK